MNDQATGSQEAEAPVKSHKTALSKAVRILGIVLFCASVASCSGILLHATKDLDHVFIMSLNFFGFVFGILFTVCPDAYTTR